MKIYEKNEHLLNNLEITYDEFKQNVSRIVVEPFAYLDNEMIFAYDGKIYKGRDLLGLSMKELREHKKNLEAYAKESDILPSNIIYKISQVYNDQYREWKYVVVKRIMEYDTGNSEVHINIVYTLVKENEKWKIMSISKNHINWQYGYEKKQGVTNEDCTKVQINNETVKFIETFDPLEVN